MREHVVPVPGVRILGEKAATHTERVGWSTSPSGAFVLLGEIFGSLQVKLTESRSREVFESTGNYVKEACDQCSQLLGCVRWTRRGESGKWCSEECRDGAADQRACAGCGARLTGKRKDAIWCDDTCRKRAISTPTKTSKIIPETLIQNVPLTGTISAS